MNLKKKKSTLMIHLSKLFLGSIGKKFRQINVCNSFLNENTLKPYDKLVK